MLSITFNSKTWFFMTKYIIYLIDKYWAYIIDNVIKNKTIWLSQFIFNKLSNI
jgi:hypothetical protein